MEHLGDPEAVLVVDETGFLKQGSKSVGVQRQYSGTAGKVDNCQIGVFLAYGSRRGRTFLDRELYLPQAWAEDGERRREAGVPEGVAFHTKGQLAQVMIARALAAGVPFGWVAGDTVYGNDRRLRRWLEERELPYVLAVKNNEPLWADTEGGSAPEPDQGHWLLVRRSITDSEDLAYYACFGAAEVALAELVRVAGTRWIIEDAFKEAKQEVGLDEYEVRRWTRVVPAHHSGAVGSCLSGGNPVLCHRSRRKRGVLRVAELIPMTVPEVRRLLCRLLWQRPQNDDLTLRWSRWRRRHQARAWQSHRKRRLPRLPNHVRL